VTSFVFGVGRFSLMWCENFVVYAAERSVSSVGILTIRPVLTAWRNCAEE